MSSCEASFAAIISRQPFSRVLVALPEDLQSSCKPVWVGILDTLTHALTPPFINTPPALFFVERHVRQLDPRWATSKHMQPALSLADRPRGGSPFLPRGQKSAFAVSESILRWRADGIYFDASLSIWHCDIYIACTVNFAAGCAAVTLSCRQLWKPLTASWHRSLPPLVLHRIPRVREFM